MDRLLMETFITSKNWSVCIGIADRREDTVQVSVAAAAYENYAHLSWAAEFVDTTASRSGASLLVLVRPPRRSRG
jgi:hypothetical protein